MNTAYRFLSVILLGSAIVACSSPEKMAKEAENVTVASSPAVLEAVAGTVNAKLTVTYPKDYFHPKAILEVTPVVVYEGGELALPSFMYQGEKVQDNYKVVPSAGSSVTENISFDYVKGMEKSYVELRSIVSYSGKSINLPAKKAAVGLNTTYMLAALKSEGLKAQYKDDEYESVINVTEEGQILYNVNSADVRDNELKGKSVKDFKAALDEAKTNERKTILSTEVVAYASPEGQVDKNNKLSTDRSKSATEAWNKAISDKSGDAPAVKSIGEDWEGFQQLVAGSNIEDKDLILRVLSMYSDPAVRESEIRNISEVFTELKSSVLPELRRARFIANIQYANYTEEELMTLVDENIDVLDEEALLHVASLVPAKKKVSIYNKAIQKFQSDRAQYNLGVAYLELGILDKAEAALAAVLAKDSYLSDAKAVLAYKKGDLSAATTNIAASENADNKAVMAILNGDYQAAVAANSSDKFINTLALILNGKLAEADKAEATTPAMHYLKAIIAARQGKTDEAKASLEKAYQDSDLAARAAKDVEFSALGL